MNKVFECFPFNSTDMILMSNRLGAEASFLDGDNQPVKHTFLLDTGAIISTMSKATALAHSVYMGKRRVLRMDGGAWIKSPSTLNH